MLNATPGGAVETRSDAVEWWYAQYALIFAHPSLLENNMALSTEFERTTPINSVVVHLRRYLEIIMPAGPPLPRCHVPGYSEADN